MKKVIILSVTTLLLFFLITKWNQDSNFRTLSSGTGDYYTDQVQPIFNARCIQCHGCYDAPCQLKLTSFEGVDRGSKKDNIYKFNALFSKDPTRLFVDEKSTKDWQEKKGFFSVTQPKNDLVRNDPGTLLMKMLDLKKSHPYRRANFDSFSSRSCPDLSKKEMKSDLATHYRDSEIHKFSKDQPYSGMPYGLPPLTDEEYDVIKTWVDMGAKGPRLKHQLPADIMAEVNKWEIFFNQESNKEKIMSRYIYEHLAFAHIYFEKTPSHFFRLVRSKSELGEIDEIASVRPFDDPKVKKFYYRLRPIKETIVHKNHITYPFSDKKLSRYKELFIDVKWNKENPKLPPYGIKKVANPFITFKDMPKKSRYKFLLDNAQYHVMTFIRGPVCRGGVALNVIDDRFWVFFVDPDKDLMVSDNDFLNINRELISPPAAGGPIDLRMDNRIRRFRKKREELFSKVRPEGNGLEYIWDGDGENDNALLTVFRHFDSSTVRKGAIGPAPKTAWLLDYALFEDIYYSLVAGYNVYGGMPHQLKTRLYMEYSRINSQDNFIDLLPSKKRMEVRNSWSKHPHSPKEKDYDNVFYRQFPDLYFGRDAGKKMNYKFPYQGIKRKTTVDYKTSDYKRELFYKIIYGKMNEKVRGESDVLNCCFHNVKNEEVIGVISSEHKMNKAFQKVTGRREAFAQFMPEFSILRVRQKNKEDLLYSIVRDSAHWNVNYLFNENFRRKRSHDVLTVASGVLASYPNQIFDINMEQASEFINDLLAMRDYRPFVRKYGVSRLDPTFWEKFDWIQNKFLRDNPIQGGVLDLGRYSNY